MEAHSGSMDREKIAKAVLMILEAVGEDPNRPGLRETPARVARMYEEILSGIGQDPKALLKVLTLENYDEIVLVRDIPFCSLCEHHMVPFLGKAHVAYLPSGGRITGLSKLARIVELEARKLQVQERMTMRIADDIMATLKPRGAMVVLEAEHLCMTIRGVKKPGTLTVTSVVRGIFRENPATRAEAMALIRG
ncbi:MAG: GTP cyclohydrolase I FolE [Phycisphaerae bacterium]|nr:GTP cyclohydrolase I FolE [Phycisphaerae bacterium]